MRRVKILLAGFVTTLAANSAVTASASAANPCKPVGGVSRCVFGIQNAPGGEPEPLHVGQAIQGEWWGRGSYFNAGRYSFLCHDVVFGGSVARFAGGAPLFATPTTAFQGAGEGGACTTSMGTAQVSADSRNWEIQLSVREPAPGEYLVADVLKTTTKEPVRFTADYTEESLPPVVCTFKATTVRGTWTWAAEEQIQGQTKSGGFKLDTEASNSPQCPASGKLETSWRFAVSPPAGGFVPVVLAIH